MKKYENAIKNVVLLLSENNYDEIISKSKVKRGESYLIKNEINDYPGTLTMPPEKAYKEIEVIKTEDKNEVLLEFYLWFNNEKSELQIILLYDKKEDIYSFWDILVP